MSKELFENLLKKFKKSNKVRRAYLASKNGYETPEDYLAYLQSMIGEQKTSKPVIHVIDVLDDSGSMLGNKYESAREGITEGFRVLGMEEGVDYVYSLIIFASSLKLPYLRIGVTPDRIIEVGGAPGILTALSDAIGRAFEVSKAMSQDKTLINIYTDGGENASKHYSTHKIASMIKEYEEDIVCTFIGTPQDTKIAKRIYSLDDSNTFSYDNTGEGLKVAMEVTYQSRSTFANKVIRGEDVSKGFYKQIIN